MEIILVVGKICSGKNHYLRRYSDQMFMKIDVGDIVRDLTKTQARIQDASLENKIIDWLHDWLKVYAETPLKGLIIAGCRQKNIVHSIMCWSHVLKYQPHIIHLHVPSQELEMRYYNSGREKDKGLSFQEAVDRDNKLGYTQMMESLYKNYPVFQLKYY